MAQYFPSLIPYRSGDLWGYADRNKNIVIDLKYDQTYPFVGNIARVIKDGLSGIINRNGDEVIPVSYEEVGSFITDTFLNDNGASSIYHQGKFGLVSIHGDVLADVQFDSEAEALAHAEMNGWKGAIPDSNFPEMPHEISHRVEAIKSFQNGVAPFKQNLLWGLITENGTIISEPRYDEIEKAENGYWPFAKNGKWGLLDSDGHEILKAEFNQTRGFSNGQAACQLGGLWGAVDTSGTWMIEPQYSELGELKDGLVAAQKDGLFGFVDKNGSEKIGFQFQDVMDFDDGVCVVFDNEFIYFINTRGERVGENYVRLFGPDHQGFIHVMSGDQWGLVRTNGKFILPIAYDLPRAMGQVIQTIEEGMIPIKKGPLLGYADMNGNEIVKPQYATIDAFQEGMSLVSIPHERLNFGNTLEIMEASGSISGVFKFGFIDKAGKEVIPLKYNLAHRFERGLAFVQTETGSSGYITYDGTEYFKDKWD